VPLTSYETIRARLAPGSLIEIDGRMAHVVRTGAGEPVVLLHGFGGSAYSWRYVTTALADEFELIAVDLNGFGYTERARRAAPYTVAGQLGLVLGVMDAIGLDSAHVAGHSYGGALATHLAWRHPKRVRSLVLVDAAGADYPWERRYASAAITPLTYLFVRTRAIKRDAVVLGLERSFADDSQITPELVDAYYDRIRIEGVSRAFRGLTAPTSEPRELPDLARLDLPVLLVWGAEDELILPEAAREVAAILPRAELEVLDGVGHIPLEESPDALAELMRRFLARSY
jgi:pimeloyl-ACP methyl ester carboxylesterase